MNAPHLRKQFRTQKKGPAGEPAGPFNNLLNL